VANVKVAGSWLKRAGALVGADLTGLRRLAEETRDYLFEQAWKDPAIPDARPRGGWFPRPMIARTE